MALAVTAAPRDPGAAAPIPGGPMGPRSGYFAVFALFCVGFLGVLAFLSISNLAPVVLLPWHLSAGPDATPATPSMPWPG